MANKYTPINIYNAYLRKLDESNMKKRQDESNNRYSGSGAGMCMRKNWYAANDHQRKPKDDRSLRLLRLGTVLGQDFDKAMKWWTEDEGVKDKFYMEKPISCERLNLHGHFDLLIVDKDRKGYLYDYKTAHSYKFKQLFGRKPDGSPANNYEYQLGTYAFMLEESKDPEQDYCDEIVHMENIYINKDNSVVKSKVIDLQFKEFAKEYWNTTYRSCYDKAQPPSFGTFAPAYTWECGDYCDFVYLCDSPYKKKQEIK